jgi:hypothetical protein
MTAPSNPLVPRVLANRLWAICFGQGLSRRLDDHGAQGEPPSHPELLDWLASDLRDGTAQPSGTPWNLRAVLREIVTSRAYQRSSTAPRAAIERDPENRLLGRQNRLRVEAEMVRDTALSAAGLLTQASGPGGDDREADMFGAAPAKPAIGPKRGATVRSARGAPLQAQHPRRRRKAQHLRRLNCRHS